MRDIVSLIFSLTGMVLSAQNFYATHRHVADLPTIVSESSGLVTAGPDKVWTHNDSGYDNELYLVDTNGVLMRTLVVLNATNVDWEDLARDHQGNIWINDAGNNGNGRNNLRMYRISDPDQHSNDTILADIIDFTYPDQTAFPPPANNLNFDIEAIIWHSDSLYLFTKNRSTPFNGYTKMYSLPAQPGAYVATLRDSLFVDSDAQRGRITASDFDTVTNTLALLTRSQVLCFRNFQGTDFFGGDLIRYGFLDRTDQVEALAFVTPTKLYMTDEGSPANNVPGRLYEVELLSDLSVGEVPRQYDLWQDATGKLHVDARAKQAYEIKIYNTAGKLIFTEQSQGRQTLPLAHLPAGLYVVEVSTLAGDGAVRLKVVR